MPKPTTTKKTKRCAVTVITAGRPTRRWVDAVTFVAPGEMPKTLRGAQLPDSILLDLGPSQESENVLEFFQLTPVATKKPDQSELQRWHHGHAVISAVAAVIGFQLLLAVANAIAAAL